MTKSTGKVAVNERALLARINRFYRSRCWRGNQRKQGPPCYDWLKVCKCRSDAHGFHNLGSFYILDLERNMLIDSHVDLELHGRKIGVLREFEVLILNKGA
jgi:hypothetical protein